MDKKLFELVEQEQERLSIGLPGCLEKSQEVELAQVLERELQTFRYRSLQRFEWVFI